MSRTLEYYHDRIEAQIEAGQLYLSARTIGSEDIIKRRIADAGLLIASYQLYVHREVFVPLLATGDASTRVRVNELKVECIALTEDLRANVRDFASRVADAPFDWDSTAQKVAWYNERVRKHIASVREMMAPELSDADHARLRARRTDSVGIAA